MKAKTVILRKHSMKYWFVSLLLVGSSVVYGQKPHSGTFVIKKKDIGFESDIFKFQKDGTFQYLFFTCTGQGLGKGRYEITKDDSLKLFFSDCDHCQEADEYATSTTNSDSVRIQLKVESREDGSALPGVSASFQGMRIGFVSDANGIINMRLPKFKENKVLTVSFIGFEPVEILVKKEYSALKGIIRLSNSWVYGKQDVKSFKILRWTGAKLQLQRYPQLRVSYHKIWFRNTEKFIQRRLGEELYQYYQTKVLAKK